MVQYDMDSELNTRTWTARLPEDEVIAEIHEPPNVNQEDIDGGDGPSQQPTNITTASEAVNVIAQETAASKISQEQISQPVESLATDSTHDSQQLLTDIGEAKAKRKGKKFGLKHPTDMLTENTELPQLPV